MARKFYLKSAITQCLRQLTYRYPPRNEALADARVSRGLYKCRTCGKVAKKKEINIDHIFPVVPVIEGFTTWDNYINRMFCPKEQFQVLCLVCHETKSSLENATREIAKSKRTRKKLNK